MRARGFTLLEVLSVVVIIAILAAVAIPQYTKTTGRRYWQTARDLLQTIYSGEQVYETAKGTYIDADNAAVCTGVPPIPPIWRCIYVDNPNTGGTIPVTFTVSGVTATTFTATATYTPNGKTQTVNQNRTWGGTWTPP